MGVELTDLGPANVSMFCLMSSLQVGNLIHIGSRNITPSMVIDYDPGARRVVRRHDLGPGRFVQALAAAPSGRQIYAGLVGCDAGQPNVFAIDPRREQGLPRATVDGLDVRVLTVAPDGELYAAGKEAAPGIWHLPAIGTPMRLAVPDPQATQSRGLAADDTHVYFGSGSNLSGGHGASHTGIFAVDRRTGEVADLTPTALRQDPAVRQLCLAGRLLLVGTQGKPGQGHLAAINLDAPDKPVVWELPGTSVGCFHVVGDGTVLLAARAIHRLDLATLTLSPGPMTEAGERWGLATHHDEILTISAMGSVVHTSSSGEEWVPLTDVGAPALPQLGMSLQAADNAIYVGGNGGVVEHRLDRSNWRRLSIPGEAKTITSAEGSVWFSVYSSQGIWRLNPDSSPPAFCETPIPAEFNRPQDSTWDSERRALLVGYQSDTLGGGALVSWQPESRALDVVRNPLDEFQMVRSVAVDGSIVFLGGWNRYARGRRGSIMAMDAMTWRETWRNDDSQDGVSCLGVLGDHLYAVTTAGMILVLDKATGATIRNVDHSAHLKGLTRLVTVADRVIIGSADTVLEVTGPDLRVTTLATGLNGQWYSGPKIAADRSGRLFTLSNRNLVMLTTTPEKA